LEEKGVKSCLGKGSEESGMPGLLAWMEIQKTRQMYAGIGGGSGSGVSLESKKLPEKRTRKKRQAWF
jgi:hypothetical protein